MLGRKISFCASVWIGCDATTLPMQRPLRLCEISVKRSSTCTTPTQHIVTSSRKICCILAKDQMQFSSLPTLGLQSSPPTTNLCRHRATRHITLVRRKYSYEQIQNKLGTPTFRVHHSFWYGGSPLVQVMAFPVYVTADFDKVFVTMMLR